jgi:hypothetical protein
MVRAKDKPVAIDQEQAGTMLGALPGSGGWWHTIRIRQIQRETEDVQKLLKGSPPAVCATIHRLKGARRGGINRSSDCGQSFPDDRQLDGGQSDYRQIPRGKVLLSGEALASSEKDVYPVIFRCAQQVTVLKPCPSHVRDRDNVEWLQ